MRKAILVAIGLTLLGLLAGTAYAVKQAETVLISDTGATGKAIKFQNSFEIKCTNTSTEGEPVTLTSLTVTRPNGVVDTYGWVPIQLPVPGNAAAMDYPGGAEWQGSDGSSGGDTTAFGVYRVQIDCDPVETLLATKVEVDEFDNTWAKVTVGMPPPLLPQTIALFGPTTVEVDLASLGDASDECPSQGLPDQPNGLEEVHTEIVQMELTGISSLLGPIAVRLRPEDKSPGQPSVGQMEESTNHNAGTLDIPPFIPPTDPPDTACSFFDVYFEIELMNPPLFVPAGWRLLHNETPKRMQATITEKPPAENETYESPEDIPLFDEDNKLTPIKITAAHHTPKPSTGGTTEILVDSPAAAASAAEASGSSAPPYAAIGGVAAAAAVALAAGGWYARRRLS